MDFSQVLRFLGSHVYLKPCFLAMLLLQVLERSLGGPTCPSCGSVPVPYPLSTGPNCGDPNYRILCLSSKLFFKDWNGSSYPILSINLEAQTLLIKPSPIQKSSCVTEDFSRQGILLNPDLPFNITSRTTIMLLNCSPRLRLSPLNCSDASLCHRYKDEVETARACKSTNLCCTFLAGGSSSAHKIHVWNRGCKAYASVVDLNFALPASQWTEGVEIQWAAPPEPLCASQQDCANNSLCLKAQDTSLRCLCKPGFNWNHFQGICTKNVPACHARGNCHQREQWIAGLTAGLVASLAIILGALLYGKRRIRKGTQKRLAKQRSSILGANSPGKTARIFTAKEVKKATNGFSKNLVLGTGGFGEVYKGTLEDGTVVAVKAAKVGNSKGTDQVLNEVRILSQVNHKNLVRLLGCCVESDIPLMIYEYIPKGTLADHLHKNPTNLDWKTRLKIALQTAEGLAYLHSSAYTPIYHRDVKSSNILLDNKLNAKVADFGLSRLAEVDLTHVSTCAQGTLGYLDPEYYRNYQLTDKSDVYSFGVVLLELVTSQKAIDFSRGPDNVNLAMYVAEKSEQGEIMDVVDPMLKMANNHVVMDTIKAFTCLALGCLQEKRQDRPTMKEVAEELDYIITVLQSGEPDPAFSFNSQVTNTQKIDEAELPVPLNWPY